MVSAPPPLSYLDLFQKFIQVYATDWHNDTAEINGKC